MTHLAPSGPQQAEPSPYGAARSAAYTAACPCCAGEADWHASATSRVDLAHTSVDYRIECAACTSCLSCVVEEIA